MQQDWFHNRYTTQQLLHILCDIADDLGLDVEWYTTQQRCSIARALEATGVEFRG
jgi:hypothetical protein